MKNIYFCNVYNNYYLTFVKMQYNKYYDDDDEDYNDDDKNKNKPDSKIKSSKKKKSHEDQQIQSEDDDIILEKYLDFEEQKQEQKQEQNDDSDAVSYYSYYSDANDNKHVPDSEDDGFMSEKELSEYSNSETEFDLKSDDDKIMNVPIVVKKRLMNKSEETNEETNEEKKCNIQCDNCRVNYEMLNLIKSMNDRIINLESTINMLAGMPKTSNRLPVSQSKEVSIGIPELTKKMNALDWLNMYIKPFQSLDNFVNNLTVKLCHFEDLIEYKIGDVVQKIIQTNFVKTPDKRIYPFYSSVAKAGKVYVYTETNVWELVTLEYLSKFISSIQKKLFKQCTIYQTKVCSKEGIDKAQHAILKLTSIRFTQDAFMNRVRYDLHAHLKSINR